jgi:hypothetical protein
LQYWVLNSKPPTCLAGALSLDPHTPDFLL